MAPKRRLLKKVKKLSFFFQKKEVKGIKNMKILKKCFKIQKCLKTHIKYVPLAPKKIFKKSKKDV